MEEKEPIHKELKTKEIPTDKKVLVSIIPPVTLAPTTTTQQDITTAGQRRINLIWEITQGTIALMVTGSIIFMAIYKIQSTTLDNAFVMIITMYYIRTNHTKIGGVGHKEGER